MFEFIENLKIREIIYRYRDFKKSNLSLNEDQLCRLTISKKLKDNPYLYSLSDDSDDAIKRYMDDLFKNKLNLKDVCQWYIKQWYPKKYYLSQNSHDLYGWRERIKDLEERIEFLLSKIPGI